MNNLTQIIFIRKDLIKKNKFTNGMLMAQACHASLKSVWLFKDEPKTKLYLDDIENMSKVILSIKQEDISNVIDICVQNGIKYTEWIEMPENILTALATEVIDKTDHKDLKIIFSGYKLF